MHDEINDNDESQQKTAGIDMAHRYSQSVPKSFPLLKESDQNVTYRAPEIVRNIQL